MAVTGIRIDYRWKDNPGSASSQPGISARLCLGPPKNQQTYYVGFGLSQEKSPASAGPLIVNKVENSRAICPLSGAASRARGLAKSRRRAARGSMSQAPDSDRSVP